MRELETKENKKRYIDEKIALWDYVLIIPDGTSVSTFLCTRKLRPEEVTPV